VLRRAFPILGSVEAGEPAVGTRGRGRVPFCKLNAYACRWPQAQRSRPATGPGTAGCPGGAGAAGDCETRLAGFPCPPGGGTRHVAVGVPASSCGAAPGDFSSGASGPMVAFMVPGGCRQAAHSTLVALVLTRDHTGLLAAPDCPARSEEPITALISAFCGARISAQRTLCPLRNFGAFPAENRCRNAQAPAGPANRPDPAAPGDRGVPPDYSMPAATGAKALRPAFGHAAGTGSYVQVYLRPR
jgi:hypothetical protein